MLPPRARGCNPRSALAGHDMERLRRIELPPRGWQPRARPSSCNRAERMEVLETSRSGQTPHLGSPARSRLRESNPLEPFTKRRHFRSKPAWSRVRDSNPLVLLTKEYVSPEDAAQWTRRESNPQALLARHRRSPLHEPETSVDSPGAPKTFTRAEIAAQDLRVGKESNLLPWFWRPRCAPGAPTQDGDKIAKRWSPMMDVLLASIRSSAPRRGIEPLSTGRQPACAARTHHETSVSSAGVGPATHPIGAGRPLPAGRGDWGTRRGSNSPETGSQPATLTRELRAP